MSQIYDITIIGGGPVGLYAAFYAGMRQAKTKIIESLDLLGGQPAHLYPEKAIYDIPAHYQIKGGDLTQSLIQQLDHFDTTICTGQEARQLIQHEDEDGKPYYEIQTPQASHFSRAVIIAVGNGAFRPRKLDLAEAPDFEGKSLHYFVRQPEAFQDRVVAICGGGDSALDWALAIEPYAKQVHLIHRRPQFRAHEHSVSLLESSSVKIWTPYIPVALHGQGGQLDHLTLQVPRQEESVDLAVDDFIVSYGFVSSLGEIAKWPLTIKRQTIETGSCHQTNLPGVYAIGDIAQYQGKTKLIATGFGEATTAVSHAMASLYPERNNLHVHSSSLFDDK